VALEVTDDAMNLQALVILDQAAGGVLHHAL
jgi:hypothetical protein